jgi:two-component system sensor histidine kinase KdpD
MKQKKFKLSEALFTAAALMLAFLISVVFGYFFDAQSVIPMIFVLAVFLISFRCQGYFWGIVASLLGVLVVNYAFTFPYYRLDLITPVNMACAAVMIVVAIMTGTLTTKLKKQEKLRADRDHERMRGNLLRAVSHDLRTPLTSIYGACSTVAENYDQLTRSQHLQLLNDATKDAEWLVRMVENLLSVTRFDSGGVALNKFPTVLEELIDNVLVKFKKRCPETEVLVTIPDSFVSVPMDAMLIDQVLLNLLENAVHHAKGMTKLQLNVTLTGKYARFCVEDDGCGIPPEKLDMLFTGYLSPDTSADSSRSNMGIGLSVCSAIIKAHGGEITAENKPDGGARFIFLLEREDDGE